MSRKQKMECPICRGQVSTAMKGQTLTEALDQHIKLTHALKPPGAPKLAPNPAPDPFPIEAAPSATRSTAPRPPGRRRVKKTSPTATTPTPEPPTRRRLVKKRP